MEDSKIIDLYWERNEKAISATEQKYGSYCYYIAYNILHDQEDADESVNDTYLGAWNAIPPHRPNMLRIFLGKITRSISLKKWRDAHRDKRGGDEVSLVLDELSEYVPIQSFSRGQCHCGRALSADQPFSRHTGPNGTTGSSLPLLVFRSN